MTIKKTFIKLLNLLWPFKCIAATHLKFAAINFVAAGNIDGIKTGAAKTQIGRRA
jgi:hypothetical protein